MHESRFCRPVRHNAFTLVEVAVALAIFVVGAIAIIRIFPSALGVIQNSGDRQVAIALNRSMMARLENKPELVPAAIYDAKNYDGADTTNDFIGAVIGTPTKNASLPRNNVQDFDDSSLAHFKKIVGEGHTIGANPSVFTQFAIDSSQPVEVYEEDKVYGVAITSDGKLNFDYAELASTGSPIAGPVATLPASGYRYNSTAVTPIDRANNTTFYISYRWLDSSNRVHGITDEAVQFSTNDATVTPAQVIQGIRGETVVSGNVQVRFRRFKTAVSASADGSLVGQVALTGFLQGQKITLDYTVADWRWLMQDGSPSFTPDQTPTGSIQPRMMPLSVKYLNDELPISLYSVFTSFSASPISSYGASTAPSGGLLKVEPKTSQLIYETNTLTAPRVRVSYRTLDEWTHQLSVAASSYVPYYKDYSGNNEGVKAASTATIKGFNPYEPWRYYVRALTDAKTIYFPPSEAGKSLMLNYTHNDSGATKEARGVIVIISEDVEDAPAIATDIAIGGKVAVAHPLLDDQGNPIAILSLLSVRGIGVHSRTAWLNGDKFTQSSIISYRGAKS